MRVFVQDNMRAFIMLTGIVVLSSFILWLPFLFRIDNWMGIPIPNASSLYLYRNFDGLLYVVPAKTLYNPHAIEQLFLEQSTSPEYYAAHLPLYPLMIALGAPLLGYMKSMIATNVVFTLFLAWTFYTMLKQFRLTHHPLALTIVLLFLPRFLVVRSVGAPESLFMLCILLSIIFFEKKHYWGAGIFGALATMTKIPGILLFGAYLLVFVEQWVQVGNMHRLSPYKSIGKKIISWSGLLLIPLGLGTVFTLYAVQYYDFFAYWHTGGVVPLPYPYAVFNYSAQWVHTAWLEDVLWYIGLYVLTVVILWKSSYRSFFYFSLIFLGASLFIQHRDIARYTLPLWPFAIIALAPWLNSRQFRIVGLILLPAIYLYAWNFATYNVMPISDWAPYQ